MRKLSPEKKIRWELAAKKAKQGEFAKTKDFPGGHCEYVRFRKWQKRQLKKKTSPPPSPPSPRRYVFPSPPPLSQPPPQTDLSPFFPQWQSMTELERNFYRVGFEAAKQCDESGHKAQLWRAFARAGAPDQFGDRDRKQTFTPDEYAKAIEHISSGDNDETILTLLAAHVEQNGGQADPYFIETLISMKESE